MGYTPIYGFPCVEDPRDFSPDVESCSPAEIEAHRIACQNYGKASYQPNAGCSVEYDDAGRMVKHVLRSSWGIGVNLIRSCDECGNPPFDAPLMTCHECGEREFCDHCWTEHERRHED